MESDVLELGAGVGLPSLLLADLKRRLVRGDVHMHVRAHNRIVCTDFEYNILQNLSKTIERQFLVQGIDYDSHIEDTETIQPAEGNAVHVNVEKLDWNEFSNCPTPVSEVSSREDHQNTCVQLVCEVDVMIGAALCYAPSHVAIADVIYHAMVHGQCREVLIIQIADRAGFDMLIRRLEALQLKYEVNAIDADTYAAAKSLQTNQLDGSWKQVVVPNQLLNSFMHNHMPSCTLSQEEPIGDLQGSSVYPPLNNTQEAIDSMKEACKFDTGVHEGNCTSRSFVRTQREAFVLLKIYM
jgi:hypothetical protein